MSGSLWNYYRGKTYGVDANSSNGRSFKYKTKVVGKSPETPEGPHYHHKIQMEHNHHYHHNQQYNFQMLKSLFHPNILVMFEDFLIYY